MNPTSDFNHAPILPSWNPSSSVYTSSVRAPLNHFRPACLFLVWPPVFTPNCTLTTLRRPLILPSVHGWTLALGLYQFQPTAVVFDTPFMLIKMTPKLAPLTLRFLHMSALRVLFSVHLLEFITCEGQWPLGPRCCSTVGIQISHQGKLICKFWGKVLG